jgi:uncharacterized damage-inducible protein DinB
VSFAKQSLLDDVSYSAWANRLLLDGCSALSPEELERDLHISHSGILATLRHICDGEKVWLDCLRSTETGGRWRLPTGTPPEPSLDALRQIWPEIWDGFRSWLEALPEAGLADELTIQLPDEFEPCFPRSKILRHVLDHSTLHRGQLVGMFRMLGHKPPAINRMDYYLAPEPATAPSVRPHAMPRRLS